MADTKTDAELEAERLKKEADALEADRVAKEKAAQKLIVDEAAARQKALTTQPFTFSGSVGTPFTITANEGHAFGTETGAVSIGGVAVVPTGWNDTRIKGVVPGSLKHGVVDVVVNGKKITARV